MPSNKENVVQSLLHDACQTPKKRSRRSAPLPHAKLQDLLVALAMPETVVEGESFTTRQVEQFTKLADLPVPSVLEVHAVQTTIGGTELGRV